MSVSHLRLAKSETRDLADVERSSDFLSQLNRPTEWEVSNSAFFAAFVVIAAFLAVVALIMR